MKRSNQTFYEDIHNKYWKSSTDDKEIGSIFSDRICKSKKLISAENPRRILNLGFESIEVASYIISNMDIEEYILVDIDENRCKIPKELIELGYKSINMDISTEKLPFEDNHFDLVYAGEIIEHLWNPDFAIREIYRVTKEGGTDIITTPNLASWYNRLLLLTGLTPINVELSSEAIVGRRFKFLGNGSPPVGHIRVFTKQALLELCGKQGIVKFSLQGYKRGDVRMDGLFSKLPSLASGFILKITKSH